MNKNTGLKKISLQVIYFVNIICLLLLVSSNLAHFLNPAKWWMIALTGLAFPLFLVLVIAFTVFWFFADRKKIIIPLLLIFASFPNIKRCFAIHPATQFAETKKAGNIRVVTWNVGLMNYEEADSAANAEGNAHIFNSLKELNPDIICLQEFFTDIIPDVKYNFIDSISHLINLPYHYFSFDRSQFNGVVYCGSIIFSKFKIVDTAKITFPKTFIGSVIKTGLLVNNDTIDIITTRLQSFHLEKDDYQAIHNLKTASPEGLSDSRSIIDKLKYGYTQKLQQINLVKQLINDCRRPVIFTGDLNDVPSSYTYSNIKNNMSDAWLDRGFGIGRTFRFIFPSLRIDYIFYNDFFQAEQTRRILTTASDHNGLVADLSIKKR